MLTEKLTSIANAIREKGGTTEKLTLAQMPDAIAAIQAGGGGEDGVPNPLVYSGDCGYAFTNDKYNWLIENYGDRIQAKDITAANQFSYYNKLLETIPFDITVKNGNYNCHYMFSNNEKLKSIGKITVPLYNVRGMFISCKSLRYLPEIEFIPATSNIDSNGLGEFFSNCYSLREIPESILGKLVNPNGGTSGNGTVFNGLTYLSTIDEIIGIPTNTTTLTSNCMGSMFRYCYRLKRATFKTNNGTPNKVNWKGQTISFNSYTGWAGYSAAVKEMLNWNSGITAEDEDNGRDTNPNYWSKQYGNSRFGRAAAVEFINSLPDTSEYLAANGGTNSIKFYSNAGSNVGDNVNSLTEEEIAVASAKGWTISYTTSGY